MNDRDCIVQASVLSLADLTEIFGMTKAVSQTAKAPLAKLRRNRRRRFLTDSVLAQSADGRHRLGLAAAALSFPVREVH